MIYGFFEGFEVFFFEQGGAGDGDGFVAGTHQGHAVGDALGDEEGFAWLELLQYGEVEDVALATLGELEPGMIALPQVAGLHADQLAVDVAVGDEQGGTTEPPLAAVVAHGHVGGNAADA